MDAISYSNDYYGKTKGNFVTENRATGIDGWKRHAMNGSNETIFKGSVSFLENIDFIVMRSSNEAERVINMFRNKGIFRLPDGRKIEDAVFGSEEYDRYLTSNR